MVKFDPDVRRIVGKNRKVYIKFATIEGNKNSKLLEKLKTRAKKLPPDSNGIL